MSLGLNPFLRITGIDISQEMLRGATAKRTKRKLEGNLKFVRGDWLNLPFKERYFDAAMVAFAEVLQYYGMERFLYRFSRSEYADKFILLKFFCPPIIKELNIEI